MPLRKIVHAALALLIAAWPIASSAQAPTTSVEEAGLLVGFDGGTLWLPLHNDSQLVTWRAPYLIVPRRDGYWQIGSAERCGLDIDSAHGGGGIGYTLAFRLYWRGLAIARAGERSAINVDKSYDCDAAETSIRATRVKQFQDALIAAKGDTSQVQQPRPDQDDVGLDCTVETNTVTFASANAIGIESSYSETEACAPGGYTTSLSNLVRGFASERPIRLFSLISRRELAKAPVTSEGGCTFSGVDSTEPSWVPRRSKGRWIISTFAAGPNVCRGGEDAEYELRLPQSFTGEPRLPVAWHTLEQAYPSLRDASASPSRRLVAIVIDDAIIVRRIENGKLGAEVARAARPPGATGVMYRWASAIEAAKWSHDLPKLPPPRIRVIAPARIG